MSKSDGDKLYLLPLIGLEFTNLPKYNDNLVKIKDTALNETEKNARRITLK